jgi:tetratricopeptide (TPR) repeat protein
MSGRRLLRGAFGGLRFAGVIIAALVAVTLANAEEAMTPAQEQAMTEIFTQSGDAGALFKARRFTEAEAIYRQVLAKTEEFFPGEGLMRAASLHNLAAALAELGQYREARGLAQEAYELRGSDPKAGAFAEGNTRALFASILFDLGQVDEAARLMNTGVGLMTSDPNTPADDLVRVLAQYVGMLAEIGAIQPAEQVAKRLSEQAATYTPAQQVDAYWALGRLRSAQGRLRESDRSYRLAYDALAKAAPDDVARRSILIANIASILRQESRRREAEGLFRRAAADLASLYPSGHPSLASVLDGLGLTIAEQGRAGEAWPLQRQALDMRLAFLPEAHPLVATSLNNLGLSLLRDGQLQPARDAFESAVARRQQGGDAVGAARASVNLAVVRHALGDTAGAAEVAEAARAVLEKALPAGHPLATTAGIDQAWFLLALGDNAKALLVARQVAEALVAGRELAAGELDAQAPDEDKRRIVVRVAAAWAVAEEK